MLPTLKYSTQKHYLYVIETHLLPTFGNLQLRLISREAVQNFLLLKLKQGLSWKTVKHIRTVLGTPRGTLTAILGHSSPEITELYVHSLPAGAREAVEKVEALLIGPNRTQIEEIQNLGTSLIQ